jgi:hypothetical protein
VGCRPVHIANARSREAFRHNKPAGDVGTSAGYAVLEVDGNEGLHRQSSNLRRRKSFLSRKKARLLGGPVLHG